jgi:hypothetical protein
MQTRPFRRLISIPVNSLSSPVIDLFLRLCEASGRMHLSHDLRVIL